MVYRKLNRNLIFKKFLLKGTKTSLQFHKKIETNFLSSGKAKFIIFKKDKFSKKIIPL